MTSFQMLGQERLAYNFKAGDFFRIKQNAKQHIFQDIDGYKQEIINDLDAVFSFEVTDVRESNYIIQLAFVDFGMKMSSPTMGAELMNVRASEPKPEDIQSMIFSGLLGQQLEMVMRKDGKILEVKGGDALIDNMITKAGIVDEVTKNQMRLSLGNEFGSESLAHSFEQMTYFYPASAINGDTWSNEFSGKLSAKNTWKLDNSTADGMDISGKALITMLTASNGTEMSLSGTQSTTIRVDASNGFLKTMESESSVEGISKSAQLPGKEIPTTIQSTISYELIQQ